MTPVRTRLSGVLILAGTAALAVASCAAHPARTAGAAPARTVPSSTVPPSTVPPSTVPASTVPASTVPPGAAPTQAAPPAGNAVTPRSPRQLAEAQVNAILASFVPPPGAIRLPTAPSALNSPITSLGDAFQASGVRFWAAPGDPQALLAWETAHLPKQYTAGDADFGPPSWDRMFDLPPIPGVLPTREMVVEVTGLAGGLTGFRVDAHVGWQPVRTASQQVPATAKAVTITVLSASRPVAHPPGPATVTDPGRVAALAALVNSLPISPFNGNVAISCPATRGLVSLRLTFSAAPHGPGIASLTTGLSCGLAAFAAPGAASLNLTESPPIAPLVLKTAGLDWKLS